VQYKKKERGMTDQRPPIGWLRVGAGASGGLGTDYYSAPKAI